MISQGPCVRCRMCLRGLATELKEAMYSDVQERLTGSSVSGGACLGGAGFLTTSSFDRERDAAPITTLPACALKESLCAPSSCATTSAQGDANLNNPRNSCLHHLLTSDSLSCPHVPATSARSQTARPIIPRSSRQRIFSFLFLLKVYGGTLARWCCTQWARGITVANGRQTRAHRTLADPFCAHLVPDQLSFDPSK
jgi:hypothetical protein